MLAGTVRRLDRRRVVKLTGFSQLGDRGRGLTREGLGNSLHVVRDGVLLSGGDGVLAILTTLYYPLGILERHQRLRGLVRKAYRGIADIIHG